MEGSAILNFPVKRGLAHIELLHSLNSGKFSPLPLGGHPVKVRGGDGLAAPVLALDFGNLDALPLALKDIFPLQLGNSAKHSEHKFPGGGGGVDSLLLGHKLPPFAASWSTSSSRSRVLRAKRLMDSTMTVSPRRT